MTEQLPPEVADLSPAARLVYRALEDNGPMTTADLVDETALTQRSIYQWTTELETIGVIESRPDPTEPRRKLYERC